VVDIGGRSTELILGRQYQAHEVASFRIGSVSWSKQFFADGQLTAAAFRQAETAAQAMLEEALAVYRPERWERRPVHAGPPHWRHRHDRDGDGVPDRHDRRPNDPRRY